MHREHPLVSICITRDAQIVIDQVCRIELNCLLVISERLRIVPQLAVSISPVSIIHRRRIQAHGSIQVFKAFLKVAIAQMEQCPFPKAFAFRESRLMALSAAANAPGKSFGAIFTSASCKAPSDGLYHCFFVIASHRASACRLARSASCTICDIRTL